MDAPPGDPGRDVGSDLQATSLSDLLDTPLFGRSPTKLRILHSLSQRRKTSAEISRDLELDPAGIHRHLQGLVDGGYLERVESGRKWVYYELSGKGRALVRLGSGTFLIFVGAGAIGGLAFTVLRWWYQVEYPGPTRGPSGPLPEAAPAFPWLAIGLILLAACLLFLVNRAAGGPR